MSCDEIRDRLGEWAVGATDDEGIGPHLEECAGCAREVESLRTLEARLRRLPARPERMPAPEKASRCAWWPLPAAAAGLMAIAGAIILDPFGGPPGTADGAPRAGDPARLLRQAVEKTSRSTVRAEFSSSLESPWRTSAGTSEAYAFGPKVLCVESKERLFGADRDGTGGTCIWAVRTPEESWLCRGDPSSGWEPAAVDDLHPLSILDSNRFLSTVLQDADRIESGGVERIEGRPVAVFSLTSSKATIGRLAAAGIRFKPGGWEIDWSKSSEAVRVLVDPSGGTVRRFEVTSTLISHDPEWPTAVATFGMIVDLTPHRSPAPPAAWGIPLKVQQAIDRWNPPTLKIGLFQLGPDDEEPGLVGELRAESPGSVSETAGQAGVQGSVVRGDDGSYTLDLTFRRRGSWTACTGRVRPGELFIVDPPGLSGNGREWTVAFSLGILALDEAPPDIEAWRRAVGDNLLDPRHRTDFDVPGGRRGCLALLNGVKAASWIPCPELRDALARLQEEAAAAPGNDPQPRDTPLCLKMVTAADFQQARLMAGDEAAATNPLLLPGRWEAWPTRTIHLRHERLRPLLAAALGEFNRTCPPGPKLAPRLSGEGR